MNNTSRKSIMWEVAVVLVFAAVLLAVAGYLVQNVVISVRSLDMEQMESDFDISSLEKAMQEIVGKLMPEKQALPQPQQQPGAVSPATAIKKAEVKQVRFFEAGKNVPAPKERKYNDRFGGQARYIYTEVNYKNNNYKVQDVQIPVVVQYYDAAGKMLAERKGVARPKKEWSGALYIVSCGDAQPGWWPNGQYTVKVFIDDEYVGDYSFKIE